MIIVKYTKNKLKINGHANFTKTSNDIVCAAISGIVFGSLSWFKPKEAKIEINKKKNFISITLLQKTKDLQHLILLIVKQIKVIENKYKKNVVVQFEKK